MEGGQPTKKQQYRQVRRGPARKVTVSTAAIALVEVLKWILEVSSGVTVPNETAFFMSVIAVFLAGYVTPPSAQDQIEPKE